MISHRTVMANAARAVCDSAEVRAYCLANFGRGLAVHVGAYGDAVPGVKQAPFFWLTPVEENDAVNADETFTVRMVLGGCVKGPNGERVINNVVQERTETENGLTINGGNAIVEDLRDMIIPIIRNAKAGARISAIRREENDISHFPLEWAVIFVEYFEPESLT